MEFNQKSRGQKHHKNKIRYKRVPKIQHKSLENVPQHSHKSTSPENSISTEEDIDQLVDDFSLLANAPVGVGGHFQFKSDKNLETESDLDTTQKDLFSLDLNILQYSLNCIPFMERCGLDKSYFTEVELENMKAKCATNRLLYDNYLQTIVRMEEEPKTANLKCVTNPKMIEENEINDISKLLQPTPKTEFDSPLIKDSEVKCEMAEVDKAELEDWLDDILGNKSVIK
ncbi:hypothetical protein FQA39_LY06065 [Lamprigera yunnana]|nr:hypothetical protein FQA39_LY06065 [Lamprigera yunnana]